MSFPTGSQRELSSAYFVQDRGSIEEMTRLEIQDKMLTEGQGGVLPELTDQQHLQRVLDVGCGTGGWLMEVARTCPQIEKLVGADISSAMTAYARAQAKTQGLDQRVKFQMMDALRILEFPTGSFDLVNLRLGLSWVRTWEWTKLLLEFQRVSCPGGIIRITEPNLNVESTSPALSKLYDIALETSYRSGRLFALRGDGLTGELVRLLTQHGIQEVKSQLHTLVYRAGTQTGQYYYEDMVRFFRVALPFFQRWTRVPNDYQEIYQQALKEMQKPDFVATITLVTAWGTSSSDGQLILIRGLM